MLNGNKDQTLLSCVVKWKKPVLTSSTMDVHSVPDHFEQRLKDKTYHIKHGMQTCNPRITQREEKIVIVLSRVASTGDGGGRPMTCRSLMYESLMVSQESHYEGFFRFQYRYCVMIIAFSRLSGT